MTLVTIPLPLIAPCFLSCDIDLEVETDRCRRWQVLSISCSHDLMVPRDKELQRQEHCYNYFISDNFMLTFENFFFPMADKTLQIETDRGITIMLPRHRRQVERSRERGIWNREKKRLSAKDVLPMVAIEGHTKKT